MSQPANTNPEALVVTLEQLIAALQSVCDTDREAIAVLHHLMEEGRIREFLGDHPLAA